MSHKYLIAGVLVAVCVGVLVFYWWQGGAVTQLLPTQLIVTASTSQLDNSLEPLILTATLTSNGTPVEGKTITWNASPHIGLGLGSGTTDSFGQVSINLLLGFSSVSIHGPVTFTASFAGDSQYQAADGNTIVVIHYP